MTPVIETRNVSKLFSGVPAIRNISFTLNPGEIHAILGENGAGKSTLTKVIAGVHEPTEGELFLNGKKIRLVSPHDGLSNGIAMVFQETNLVPAMTVAQNIYLGGEQWFNRLKGLYIAAQQFLSGMNFTVDPTALAGSLGAAHKQMVEIARAVRRNAKVIIFDEPTATLTPEEKTHFFGLVRRLVKQGVAVIFISHAIEEALLLSDRITILRDGQHIVTDETKNFDRTRIVETMVGRDISKSEYAYKDNPARPAGERLAEIRNLTAGDRVKGASFSIFAGQVTCMFGLVGSGRTEMVKVLAGITKRDFFDGGEIFLKDRPVRYRTPRHAVRDGIVYITEDRKLEGFFEDMSIAENIQIGDQVKFRNPVAVVSSAAALRLAGEWSKKLSIQSISNTARAIELSGGNQQKLVIAKSLVQNPKILIFDEPTRGVDVGAITEIHKLINSLADQGHGVLMISSYLPEILAMSDRVLIAKQGKIVEAMSRGEADEKSIMYAAVH